MFSIVHIHIKLFDLFDSRVEIIRAEHLNAVRAEKYKASSTSFIKRHRLGLDMPTSIH